MEYDIFISYARDDLAWVDEHIYRPLCNCRKLNGDRPRIFFDVSREGIQPGQDFTDSLAQSIESCRKFVAVYSPRYFERKMCRWELKTAHALDPAGDECLLIPVVMEPTPNIASYVRRIQQLSPLTTPDWFERLCDSLNLVQSGETISLEFKTQPSSIRVSQSLGPIQVAVHAMLVSNMRQDELVVLALENGELRGARSSVIKGGIATFEDLYIAHPVDETRLVAYFPGARSEYSRVFSVSADTLVGQIIWRMEQWRLHVRQSVRLAAQSLGRIYRSSLRYAAAVVCMALTAGAVSIYYSVNIEDPPSPTSSVSVIGSPPMHPVVETKLAAPSEELSPPSAMQPEIITTKSTDRDEPKVVVNEPTKKEIVEQEVEAKPQPLHDFQILMTIVANERDFAAEDLMEAVLEQEDNPDLAVYRDRWRQLTERFSSSNSSKEIGYAIERILQAKELFPTLTVKQTLQYIVEREADEIDVRVVAENILSWLVDEYNAPILAEQERQIEEQQAMAEALEANRARAQSRGAANNRARVDKAQAKTLYIESQLAPQIGADQRARDEARQAIINR
ncbi:MAG: toll/interleukin-1 receptor domain-containing protein [Candidatus Hydrogenedentes bacterium]|nr:toll/interleukin-1 receptor domain-containing protein [Candidatus Hydrogenedentota bacterium]